MKGCEVSKYGGERIQYVSRYLSFRNITCQDLKFPDFFWRRVRFSRCDREHSAEQDLLSYSCQDARVKIKAFHPKGSYQVLQVFFTESYIFEALHQGSPDSTILGLVRSLV